MFTPREPNGSPREYNPNPTAKTFFVGGEIAYGSFKVNILGIDYDDACGCGAFRVKFCRPFDCRKTLTFDGIIPDFIFDIKPLNTDAINKDL